MSNEINLSEIENWIFPMRDSQVFDSGVATIYQVETKVFNQAIKRNKEELLEAFKIQLNSEEKDELVTDCDLQLKRPKHAKGEGNSKNSNKLKN